MAAFRTCRWISSCSSRHQSRLPQIWWNPVMTSLFLTSGTEDAYPTWRIGKDTKLDTSKNWRTQTWIHSRVWKHDLKKEDTVPAWSDMLSSTENHLKRPPCLKRPSLELIAQHLRGRQQLPLPKSRVAMSISWYQIAHALFCQRFAPAVGLAAVATGIVAACPKPDGIH